MAITSLPCGLMFFIFSFSSPQGPRSCDKHLKLAKNVCHNYYRVTSGRCNRLCLFQHTQIHTQINLCFQCQKQRRDYAAVTPPCFMAVFFWWQLASFTLSFHHFFFSCPAIFFYDSAIHPRGGTTTPPLVFHVPCSMFCQSLVKSMVGWIFIVVFCQVQECCLV